MTQNFEDYLKIFARAELSHLEERIEKDPRRVIMVLSGYRLNWIGFFLGNPEHQFNLKNVPFSEIEFTGTNPEWNEILLKQCNKSPEKLLELQAQNSFASSLKILEVPKHENSDLPILLKKESQDQKFQVFDGMHRLVKKVLEYGKSNQKKEDAQINAWCFEGSMDPYCESHVVYNLITAYNWSEKAEQDKEMFIKALTLLLISYKNVKNLLVTKFSPASMNDDEVQELIQKVLQNVKT